MADTFYIKKGDTTPPIRAQLGDGTIDLTGASVKLRIRRKDVLVINSAQEFTATITDAAAGIVEYAWASGDTDNVGVYDAEWEVTFTDGTIATFPRGENQFNTIKIQEKV